MNPTRWISDYKILCGSSPEHLESDVMMSMAGLWQPFGAPFITNGLWCQAMVRYACG
jgi:hypothetical protein